MTVVFAARANAQIDAHLAYGVDRFGPLVAARAIARLRRFLHETVAMYPQSGAWNAGFQAFESWVPRTPFVVIYRVDPSSDTLIVLAVFHHAQDRQHWSPETPGEA